GGMSPCGGGGLHRHTPEIMQGLSQAAAQDVSLSFTPTLAPMPRGILTTATAEYVPGTSAESIRAACEEAFSNKPFVHLLPEVQRPPTKSLLGPTHVVMQLAVDEAAGRVIVVVAVDNLTKGTAGGAIQSMNIALGYPEETGLTVQGVAP